MFFLFSLALAEEATKITTKNFNQFIGKAEYSLIFVCQKGSGPYKKVGPYLNKIAETYADKIAVGVAEVDNNRDIISKIGASIIPSLAYYKDGKLVRFLDFVFTESSLNAFCENLILEGSITKIKTLFQFYNFTNLSIPSNVFVSGPNSMENAKKVVKAISKFGLIANVGVCGNNDVLEILGIDERKDFIQVSRPVDLFYKSFLEFNEEDIVSAYDTNVRRIESEEMFGISFDAKHTLTILYDERDPVHFYELAHNIAGLKENFGNRVSYQICDFYKCSQRTKQFESAGVSVPVYTLGSAAGEGKVARVECFMGAYSTIPKLTTWINRKAFNIKPLNDLPDDAPDDNAIPYLLGKEFQRKALNPKVDAILFVAAPKMTLYEKNRETFKQLMKVFAILENIEFYEYNPLSQHCPGLTLPKSDQPQISIWPAVSPPSGGSIAVSQLPILVDNILPMIKNQPDPEVNKELHERLMKIMKNEDPDE